MNLWELKKKISQLYVLKMLVVIQVVRASDCGNIIRLGCDGLERHVEHTIAGGVHYHLKYVSCGDNNKSHQKLKPPFRNLAG
jgi:hypothetical protein